MSDCFLRFSGTEGVPHCTPDEFMLAMIDHCKTQRIKTAVIDGTALADRCPASVRHRAAEPRADDVNNSRLFTPALISQAISEPCRANLNHTEPGHVALTRPGLADVGIVDVSKEDPPPRLRQPGRRLTKRVWPRAKFLAGHGRRQIR